MIESLPIIIFRNMERQKKTYNNGIVNTEAIHVQLYNDCFLSFYNHYDNIVKYNNGMTSYCYTYYRAWIEGRALHVKPT